MDDRLKSMASGYALALARALAACRELHSVLQLLSEAASTLLHFSSTPERRESAADAAIDELATARRSLAAAAGQAEDAARRVRAAFYSSAAFQELAETLLTVVAPDWLPRFSSELREQLFDAWFVAAPAPAALLALVGHLSAVQPSGEAAWGAFRGGAKVTAVSADEAARLLAARFAAPGSHQGVAELLQHVAGLAASQPGANGETSGQMPAAAAAGWQTAEQPEELAAALASVPERAAAVELPALAPSAFVPAVARQLLGQLAELAGQVGTGGGQEEREPPAACTAFVADVLSRFSRRGHAELAAAALLEQLQRDQQLGSSIASSVVAAVPGSAGLGKLLEGALKAAAAGQETAGASSSVSGSCCALPLDAPPGRDPSALAAAAVLGALVPPASWQARADARLLLTDKLLVQQQRGLLPLPALRGLLLFLSRQTPPQLSANTAAGNSAEQGNGSGSGDGSVLAAAAASVAQLWGDQSAVQRLAAPQQAFLTAALCASLALLGRRELEGHPRLLPLVLSGITTRLDSPLLVVRRQGMRVGQALSAVLDPSKPPMFSEDGEQLKELAPEERWEAAGPRSRRQQQAVGGSVGGAVSDAAAEAAGAAGARRSAGRGSAQLRRREEREQRRQAREARRERRAQRASQHDAEEREGPLTETDSDDAAGSGDDASSVTSSGTADSSGTASSGTAGSDSSGEMEAYDLEESDEEDPARSKLQLRDLPKMLLSGAEKDWKGQLRALRHAEYLIRAAPDELEQYAVPIARALIHTKVPGWMDEEMPSAAPGPATAAPLPAPAAAPSAAQLAGPAAGGAPGSANMQRFRDVVSLLVAAPESAGLALAKEMYGPSMDVYQRAMILDGMAAAASEMAKPGSALPPLPGLHPAAPRQLPGPAGRAQAAAAAAAAAGLSAEEQRLLTITADGRPRVGTVTRLASRSLAAAARQGGAPAGHVNRFPPVALKWAAGLLQHCDEPQHGIDLLGKDSFLLGKLLVTLGAFLEASSQSSEAATLAAATLELMRIGRVHNHPEPFVRRAALLAAGQVLGAVPPARLASAMLGSAAGAGGGGVALSAQAAARDASDEALVSRLEWLREWTEEVAARDADDSCRMMADGVRKLQASLASGALAALGSSQPVVPLDTGSLLPGLPGPSGGTGGARSGLLAGGLRLPDIRLP